MYYVRLRGKVMGPFPLEHLKELVQRGQVAAFHQLSSDGVNWTPAGSVAELFPAAEAPTLVPPVAQVQAAPPPREPRPRQGVNCWQCGVFLEEFSPFCPDCGAEQRRGPSARPQPESHSGTVTAVGIINIILGVMTVLGGVCGLLGGAAIAPMAQRADNAGAAPHGFFAALAGVLIVIAFLVILFGVGYIIAGIGVLNRGNWGRVMTLILGGFSLMGGLLSALGLVRDMTGPVRPDTPESIIILLISFMVQTGYGIFTYVVLLNSSFAEEFR